MTDSRRVVVDLTDGSGHVTNLDDVPLYVEMKVSLSASTSGTVTSADFYHDFDGDVHFARVSATNTSFGVARNSTRFAPARFGAAPDSNLSLVVTNPATTGTISYLTSTWNVQGQCGTAAVGHLVWSNQIFGASGLIAAQAKWTIPKLPLSVGTNLIICTASNATFVSWIAADSPTGEAYGDGWTSGDGAGSG